MNSKLKDKMNTKTHEEKKLLLDIWSNNKLINPYTKREIKENGQRYENLQKEYNKLNNINQETNRQKAGKYVDKKD